MGNDPEAQHKPKPARPTPAREGNAPTPARGAEQPTHPSGAHSPEMVEGAPDVEPDVDEKAVEIDGTTWTVKVKGRAGGGMSTGTESTAPLILLGFFPEDDERGEREALVVGRTLARLTPRQLEQAFATAKPPPDPGRAREIFPGTSSRRGRRGG